MKNILFILAIHVLCIITLFGQSPMGFKYQAVVRDNSGEIVSDQKIRMRISLLKGDIDGETVYREIFSPTTNEFGLVNIVVGTGTPQTGEFADIDWSTADYFIKVEIDITGGTSYTTMGTSQLLSVPYAQHAFSAAGWSSNDDAVYTHKSVGVGTDSPTGKLQIVAAKDIKDDEPIFEVVNNKGETIFAVYQNEVKVIINEDESDKMRGGFAVSGRTASKEEPHDIFLVQPGLTQVFVDKTSDKMRGGFAVSGRTASKDSFDDIFLVQPNLTQIFVNETSDKMRGGFAVSGRTASKEDFEDILTVQPGLTQIFVDETSGKMRGGFAVSGRTASKDNHEDIFHIQSGLTQIFVNEASDKMRGGFAVSGRTASKEIYDDILTIKPGLTQIFVDEASDKMRGGFAVSGRTASKESYDDIFHVQPGLTQVFIGETTSKMRGGFAVSGRTASKDDGIYDVLNVRPERTDVFINPGHGKFFPDGFGISLYDLNFDPTELFAVSEGGAVVNIGMAVAPRVSTIDVKEETITFTSAVAGGKVITYGGTDITQRGIVYSTKPNPSLESDFSGPTQGGIIYDSNISDGGFGEYNLVIEYLLPGTTYYVNAFAINEDNLVGYGTAKSFKTDSYKLGFNVHDNTESLIDNAVITVTSVTHPHIGSVTNDAGNYEFDVAEGNYSYTVSASGYFEGSGSVNVLSDGQIVTVSLEPTPSEVTFSVKNDAGEPLEDIEINIFIIDLLSFNDNTDSNGNATFNPTAGTWDYSIYDYSMIYQSVEGSFDIEADEVKTIDITLSERPSYTVTFIVTDIDGQPDEGAWVSMYPDNYYHKDDGSKPTMEGFFGETDADGKIIFTDVPEGDYYYEVRGESGDAYGNTSVNEDKEVRVELNNPLY